jgi:hypothetical protein
MPERTPWDDLRRHLDGDYAHMAVECVLRLVAMGETEQDIRRFLVKHDGEWWADA